LTLIWNDILRKKNSDLSINQIKMEGLLPML